MGPRTVAYLCATEVAAISDDDDAHTYRMIQGTERQLGAESDLLFFSSFFLHMP